MLKLFYKNDGAITVFLAMILVPIITISSLFVDASRINMADSILDSSADLTLESVLAKYDAELNDYYGLLASAQDADDFLSKSNEFLTAQMTSNGLTADEANTIISSIYASITGDDQVDLLQIALEEDSANVVTPVEGANLSDATMIKKEISEFMKYRAPINLTAELVNKFKKVSKSAEDKKEDTDLVDKKSDFYESQSELLEKAFEIFELREEYIEFLEQNDMDITAYLNDIKSSLPKYKDIYLDLHKRLFMNVYNAENTNAFSLKKIDKYDDIVSKTDLPFNNKNKAGLIHITMIKSSIEGCLESYKTAKETLQSMNFKEWKSTHYALQYWVQNMAIIKKSPYAQNIFDVYAEYANKLVLYHEQLDNALENTDAKLSDEQRKEIDTLLKQIESEYNNYWHKNSGFVYYKVGEQLEKCSSLSVVVESKGIIDLKTSLIQSELGGYKIALTNAKEKAQKIAIECAMLVELARAYESNLETWEGAANESSTDLGERDRAEINQSNNENEELIKAVSEEKVQAMQARYQKISEILQNIIDDINSYKYGDKLLCAIGDCNTMKKASKIAEEKIVLDEDTLEFNAEYSFSDNYSQPGSLAINTLNDENNPDIEKSPTDFDKWLKEKFGKLTAEERENVGKNKDKHKEIKEQGEAEAERQEEQTGNMTPAVEICQDETRPSNSAGKDDSDSENKSALEKANEALDQFIVNFTFENTMERLYTLDYIMSMFSYDTFEHEGKYKSVYKTKSGKSHLNYSGKKPTSESDAKTFHEVMDKEWKNKKTDIKFTYGKTLTNKIIDSAHNQMYGGEVEYILYGDTNQKNKQKAYSRIYLIRYAMNTVPMFMEYWNHGSVTGPATTISAATSGIVPVALVKIVIILALIAFEASLDLSLIKQGLPVPFVKTTENLYLDPDLVDKDSGKIGDTSNSSGKVSDTDDNSEEAFAFYYSDYLSLFLFTKLLGSEEETIYLRTADVIQTNMKKLVDNSEYLLKNAITYYKLEATVEIPPLMMKLPINNMEENWEEKMDGRYKIKCSAVRGY